MGFVCIVLALVLPFVLGAQSQGLQATASEQYGDISAKELHPFHSHMKDFTISELGVKEIVELLEERQKEKLKQAKSPRTLFEEYTDQDIEEVCSTYSSLECGEQVLKALGGVGTVSIQKRCRVRSDFLDCIDTERRNCKEMSRNKLFPVLPSKEIIKNTQEKVWRSLWTSGGCTLAI